MVNISFIKTIFCPICGCQTVVSESVEVDNERRKIREHCNGGHWEHRTFACGYHVYYCPNYGYEEVIGKCKFDPDEMARAEKRKAFKQYLIQKIDDGDCQDDYKKRLKEAIQYV